MCISEKDKGLKSVGRHLHTHLNLGGFTDWQYQSKLLSNVVTWTFLYKQICHLYFKILSQKALGINSAAAWHYAARISVQGCTHSSSVHLYPAVQIQNVP